MLPSHSPSPSYARGISFVPYKTLLIVESPSKCKTIEHILGPSYMCVATCGHIRDLALQPDLSTVPDIFSSERIPYTNSSKKMAHIRSIQTALSKCNGTVILATDADREGESIAWHVCQVFGLSVETTPRIVFKEITPTAIRNALDTPLRINMNLVRAQQTRQILDFIIGYGVTPLLWTWLKTSPLPPENKKTKTKTKLVQSAGRCQSPALRIMQDAYNDIHGNTKLKSNPVEYKCVGYFTKYNIPFTMTTRLKPENDVDAFLHFYTDPDKRVQIANAHRFDLSPPKLVSYKPPPPLKSTTLQKLGSTFLGLTPSETMDAAQRLYEAGHITYHRTDSTCLSADFKMAAYAFIETIWNTSYTLSMTAGSSTSTSMAISTSASDHAHEAIRPVNILVTKLLPEPESNSNGCFGKTEQMLYSLIWTRAVSSCMCDATYEKVTATVSSSGSYMYTYRYNAYRQKMAGWHACVARYSRKGLNDIHAASHYDSNDNDSNDSTDDSDDPQRSSDSDYFTYLQSIEQESSLPYNSIECYPVLKNAFVPYTYAKLIHRLEKMGIGRPSTFASIVHTLKKREYICEMPYTDYTDDNNYNLTPQTQDTPVYHKYKITTHGTITDTARLKKNKHYTKNQIQITQHGQAVVSALFPTCEPLLAYQYTREMEEALDRIAKGNAYWVDVCKKCMTQVEKLKQESGASPMTASTSRPDSGSGSGSGTGTETRTGIIRNINEHASIRDGKFGSAYIYFRTLAMKKPKFIALKGFPYDYMKCDAALLLDWIHTYL